MEVTARGESPWTTGGRWPHPSSAGSPGRGRAPEGQPCHCWGPLPRVPSCPGGFHTAHSGLAGVENQRRRRGQLGLPEEPEHSGSWGAGNREGTLTRLHGPADEPQDVGGIPQFQAVVDTHVHLAGEVNGPTRVLALPTRHPLSPAPVQEKQAQSRMGHGKVTCPEVAGEARLEPSSSDSGAPFIHSLTQ